MEFIFTAQPYRENDYRVSYVRNPESYDGITGDLGPESDPNPLRCAGNHQKKPCTSSQVTGCMSRRTTGKSRESMGDGKLSRWPTNAALFRPCVLMVERHG